MVSRILEAQQLLLKKHLPQDMFERLIIPKRHHGLNSFKIEGDKSQKPLIMLPGFGSGTGMFFPSLPPLFELTNRTIYCVDFLGCGGSDRVPFSRSKTACSGTTTKESLKDARFFTDSLKVWMDYEGVDQATIIAHSLGGLMASYFAQQNPSYIEDLVLASPAGFGHAPPETKGKGTFSTRILDILWTSDITPQQLVRLAGAKRGRKMVRNAVQRRFGSASPSLDRQLVADYLFEITMAQPSGEYALNALLSPPFRDRALVAKRPIPELLQNAKFPVRTIYGSHDWLAKIPGTFENAQRVSAVSMLPNAGHHLYLDQPELFCRLCMGLSI